MYEQRIEKYEYKQMFFNLLFGIIAISNIAVAYIYIKNDTIELITPADEKAHGFNRVDDSPQIF